MGALWAPQMAPLSSPRWSPAPAPRSGRCGTLDLSACRIDGVVLSQMKILTDGEDPSAMRLLNPCGSIEETQLRPLEPYEVPCM